MFEYREVASSPRLAAHVKCFWFLRVEASLPSAQRILPDGSFELVFQRGAPFFQNGSAQPRASLIGEIRRHVVVSNVGVADVFGIRFRPAGLSAFVAPSAIALAGLVLDAGELFAPELAERILDAPDDAHCVASAERLLGSIERDRRGGGLSRQAAAIIDAHRGNIPIRRVADLAGTTERTLERAFDDCLGCSPKVYARLRRFHTLLAMPSNDAGYYDDAHVLRDFHDFSGLTPSQLRRELNEMNEAFVGNFQDSGALGS